MLSPEHRLYKTFCVDKKCQNLLYMLPSENTVECHQCGQRHSRRSLQDVREIRSEDLTEAYQNYICKMLMHSNIPKRGPEMVKVLGLSNYHCKLLSPLLTRYGMDKNSGTAKLLTEMNQGEIFDCSLFGDRAFLIEPEHISIHGFGKDITGSLDYLSETLKLIVAYNGGDETLIPIHADGDGHCLVHAVSRALVGRELFWHPLRCCLKKHFETSLDRYKELFKDFIDTDEWPSIIDECDPDFQPPEGELHGLRNIHIFGLANVLRRPIILLDSLECMQKCGDYSALFLPGFVSPENCKGKDNTLNKPLCIAWSSYSHNHYIPLVGIQQKPLPSLPPALIPTAWGMPQSQISSYMEFDSNGGCIIGGNRTLSDAYIQRLVHSMNALYYEKNGIHPSLVADAKLYLFPDNILFCAKPAMVLARAKTAVQEGRLYRCLICTSLCELSNAEGKWPLNNSAVSGQYLQNLKKTLDSNLSHQDYILEYDTMKGEILIGLRPELQACPFCGGKVLRKVTNDGTVIYKAEDKDNHDRNIHSYNQPRKYYPVEGINQEPIKEVKPTSIPLKLLWEGKEIEDEISYLDFHDNSKTNLNQFVKELSMKLIDKHFSDKSTDVNLQAYIADEIWKLVKKYNLRNCSEPSKSEIKIQKPVKNMTLENTLKCSSKPAEFQYIKVCTSNGLQASLALTDDGISYGQLQEWIKNEFNIPVKNQVIKRGVPPRPIKPSGDTNKQMLSDLKHGDRLMVEIQRRDDNPYSLSTYTPPRNVLKDSNLPKTTVNLPCNASWNYVKASPQHFRRNGFVYKMIAENHKLNKLLHTSLDDYPNKVFCYNPMSDCIELCIKDVGHFHISNDIEERIEEVRNGLFVIGFCKCPIYNKPNEENADIAYLRTFVSPENAEQSSGMRKGPGFSVLRHPDDMDIS